MLSESKIINFFKTEYPKHIGDDSAVIKFSENESYLITKDLFIEDIHFQTRYQNPSEIAHKALNLNLSDIAAMGANPKYIILGIAIPENYSSNADKLFKAFVNSCKKHDIEIIGGDTTKSPDKLFISITALGYAKTTNVKFRNKARQGDVICVAGDLGFADIGLKALENNIDGLEYFKNRFKKPNALLNEGIWLGKQSCVTAMMDISDGLYVDLKRLCEASKIGATINLEKLTATDEFYSACDKLKIDPTIVQLCGGEDYSLLLTVKNDTHEKLSLEFKEKFNYELKKIGLINKKEKITFLENNVPKTLKLKPFSHFGEKI